MTLKEFLNLAGEYWGLVLIFLIFVYCIIDLTYKFILHILYKGKDFVSTITEDEDYDNED